MGEYFSLGGGGHWEGVEGDSCLYGGWGGWGRNGPSLVWCGKVEVNLAFQNTTSKNTLWFSMEGFCFVAQADINLIALFTLILISSPLT